MYPQFPFMFGPISWPPWSPNLSPIDFFVCDTMENIVCEIAVENDMGLEACNSIDAEQSI